MASPKLVLAGNVGMASPTYKDVYPKLVLAGNVGMASPNFKLEGYKSIYIVVKH